MRITSGKYKGRIIKMPKGIRPTQDKVRKAIFDILGDVEGLSFLELFAGTGAVGIEALSRGAQEVVFIENNRACIDTIKENLGFICSSAHLLIRLEADKALEKLAKDKKRFDIVFMDPPYYQGLAKKTLLNLASYAILAENSFIIVQHFKKDDLPPQAGDLTLFKQSRYGDTLLSFYK